MKPSIALLLAGIVAASSASAAQTDDPDGGVAAFLQEQRISGVVRADYFRSSKNLDNETDFYGYTAQVKALPRFSETLDGKLEVRTANPAIGKSSGTRGRVLEGYVTAHFDKADLRIGKQIVAWGRADGINPTDNLTPRDYAVSLPFEDDQRFGTIAAKLDMFISQEQTLTVFASPFFEPSKIPLPAGGPTFVERIPAHTLANTELGLKLSKVGDGFDWSLSYFRGHRLLPELRPIASATMSPIVELHYRRIRALGADFARNFGRFSARAEVAYVGPADDAVIASSGKGPYLSWVAGVDRTFFESLNINLQFFQRRMRRYQDPGSIADPFARGIALQTALINGQRDRINNGISFRVSNKWFNDALEAEVFAVVNRTRNDRFVRPLITYAFTDQWKGTIGAELYRGAVDTQFGSMKSNRGVFSELRYGF